MLLSDRKRDPNHTYLIIMSHPYSIGSSTPHPNAKVWFTHYTSLVDGTTFCDLNFSNFNSLASKRYVSHIKQVIPTPHNQTYRQQQNTVAQEGGGSSRGVEYKVTSRIQRGVESMSWVLRGNTQIGHDLWKQYGKLDQFVIQLAALFDIIGAGQQRLIQTSCMVVQALSKPDLHTHTSGMTIFRCWIAYLSFSEETYLLSVMDASSESSILMFSVSCMISLLCMLIWR